LGHPYCQPTCRPKLAQPERSFRENGNEKRKKRDFQGEKTEMKSRKKQKNGNRRCPPSGYPEISKIRLYGPAVRHNRQQLTTTANN
jgi:hypothetical protein